jgi:hypothetical protein
MIASGCAEQRRTGLSTVCLQVEGQMQGGTAQGFGWALNEEYVYDAKGNLQNFGLLDYRMPTCLDFPMSPPRLLKAMIEKQQQSDAHAAAADWRTDESSQTAFSSLVAMKSIDSAMMVFIATIGPAIDMPEPGARNSKRLPVKAKGLVRFRSPASTDRWDFSVRAAQQWLVFNQNARHMGSS